MPSNARVTRIREKSQVPRYVQVRQQLIRRILDGTLPPGSQLPSEPELAAQFGVSRMTANKSLVQLAQDGWLERRKGSGTFVSTKSGPPIVITLSPDFDNAEFLGLHSSQTFSEIAMAAQHHPIQHGLALVIEENLRTDQRPLAVLAIAPRSEVLQKLVELQAEGTPCISVGGPPIHSVIPQYGTSRPLVARMVLEHLTGLGHRQILIVESNKARVEMWMHHFHQAEKELGIGNLFLRPTLLEGELRDNALQMDHLKTAWRRPPGFSAVFTGAPRLAAFVHRFAHSHGFRIPEDFSLISFDDPEFLSLMSPSVSVIRRKTAQIMERGLRDLVRAAQDQSFSPPGWMADAELCPRESSGPARSAGQ